MVGKHHTANYKESAIKHYKKTKNLRETCDIFGCKKSTLQRWVTKYDSGKGLNRKKDVRKKRVITPEIVKFVKDYIRKEPNVILVQLRKLIREKYGKNLEYK